jgi:hypothetical protein
MRNGMKLLVERGALIGSLSDCMVAAGGAMSAGKGCLGNVIKTHKKSSGYFEKRSRWSWRSLYALQAIKLRHKTTTI